MTRALNPGRHACPVCDNRYATVGDKRRHLRKEHAAAPKAASHG